MFFDVRNNALYFKIVNLFRLPGAFYYNKSILPQPWTINMKPARTSRHQADTHKIIPNIETNTNIKLLEEIDPGAETERCSHYKASRLIVKRVFVIWEVAKLNSC